MGKALTKSENTRIKALKKPRVITACTIEM